LEEEDGEEDVRSYWIVFRKREDNGNWRRKTRKKT
jgi:hypothetical protein